MAYSMAGITYEPGNTATMSSDEAVREGFRHIMGKRRRWEGEEEVRLAWATALERATGLDFDAERRKRDLNFNNVIIEFKAPGLFKGKASSSKFKEATQERLLPYIRREAKRQDIDEADFIGIAIDGDHLCFIQVQGGAIVPGHLLPFTEQSFGMVVEACVKSFRRSVIAENLIEDFGHESPAATAVMQVLSDALSDALKSTETSKVKMLFEEWKELYGQVADLTADQTASIDRSLHFEWHGPRALTMPGRLFVIHTYNSLLIKLLAAEIVAAHGLTTNTAPAEAMCTLLSAKELIAHLEEDIERGGLFNGAGIKGFVEEAIFSWHLDVAKNKAYQKQAIGALKTILAKLALYRTDRLARQRDALRDFYQDLVPETLRKSLGEFYTPDWLVEFATSQVKTQKWLGKRFLDPTCGSGSFLIEVLRRKRAEAEENGLDAQTTLRFLCDEVWGFDLNPLAVQTSRVNFLMEIAGLLADAGGIDIELPVLLADAIYSPAPNPSDRDGIVEYQIGSQVASLTITLPSPLAFNRERLDQVFETMGAHVESNDEFEAVFQTLKTTRTISANEAAEWHEPLRATYEQVLTLHRKNWNGIWFRIVRNFFWSTTAGTFDVIVGNPPWVRWSKLPETYRRRAMPTCVKYDIFSTTKYHGGNELDISAIITYTTADKWLKSGGQLVFVITQSVFQNPSSSGFRNFRLNATDYLTPRLVHDLKDLKPFPDAANKTAVAVFRKTTRAPIYPIPYVLWHPKALQTRAIHPDLTLKEVCAKTVRVIVDAYPVADEGSPWAILPKGRYLGLQAMSKPTDEPTWVEGRKGITADLNGVYFLPILSSNAATHTVKVCTRPSAGRKDIGPVHTTFIEPDWLYPLIKGAADIGACYFQPTQELFALVPNRGIRKADYEASVDEYRMMPKTRNFFGHFAGLLSDRSTWKGRMRATGAPSYAVYNVGEFTFKPWKVVWAEMSGKFCAAVAGSAEVPLVGSRPYVPDHKVYFVALDDKATACYLCGILNSKTVSEFVESHNVEIQTGDIFKHMRTPEFDPSNKSHLHLAHLVEQAHAEPDPATRSIIVEEVRACADKLLVSWLKAM